MKTWVYIRSTVACKENEDVFIRVEVSVHRKLKSQCRVQVSNSHTTSGNEKLVLKTYETIPPTTEVPVDPLLKFQKSINRLLYGGKEDSEYEVQLYDRVVGDQFAHNPSGSVSRGELFNNRSMVHVPFPEFMHRGHIYLKVTRDYMQTAVDAFSIFIEGDMKDILRLPSDYVLRSSRTIAMMNIPREKLAATWTIVKDGRLPKDVSYETLEMYRPLFKYVNGREIARLNLSDDRVLNYIGTHPDLNRHQIGVVAGVYVKLNPNWRQSRYLNLMNNLICGLPMVMMRYVGEDTLLQLASQLFYHIRACDRLQRRFFLAMMTRTQVLGKPYSWSARDVSRLGLLLTELDGSDLSAINPESMAGFSAQVIAEVSPNSLKHITKAQLKYIKQKTLNILTRKLKDYEDEMLRVNNFAYVKISYHFLYIFLVVIKLL